MYITINSVGYKIRVDQGQGQLLLIEQRNRAIDGSLLVDTITSKLEVPVEITGKTGDSRFFTVSEANSLITALRDGTVQVGGDVGTFTARARDIGWRDIQDNDGVNVTVYRWVSAVLEEV